MNDFRNKVILAGMCAAVSLALTCCGLPYCKKIKFTEEELAWMAVYEEGESFTMLNESTGLQDTITIERKSIHNPRNTFIFDLEGCNWLEGDNEYHAIAVFEFTIMHKGNEYSGIMTLEKNCGNLPAYVTIGLFGNFSIEDPLYVSNTRPLRLNNSIYYNSLLFSEKQFENNPFKTELLLKYVIWDKATGLVAYQFSDDTGYYVVNR